jgi:hypothetical protein
MTFILGWVYTLSTAVLAQVASSGAAGLTLLKQTGKAKYRTALVDSEAPSGFKVKPRSYVVVGKNGVFDQHESFAGTFSSNALQKLNASN